MPRHALDTTTIHEMRARHDAWALDDDEKAIRSVFKFADFASAFAFMTEIAIIAEKLDHHPEWMNVWNKVTVRLTTHDAGGLTELDFELAGHMDRVAAIRAAKRG